MSVKKFTLEKPRILFAIILPDLIYDLYEISISEATFERVIKEHLGIKKQRLIKLVQAVQADEKDVLLLVIYDKIVKGNAMLKERIENQVKDFNFDIYNYNFNIKINIEKEIAEGDI